MANAEIGSASNDADLGSNAPMAIPDRLLMLASECRWIASLEAPQFHFVDSAAAIVFRRSADELLADPTSAGERTVDVQINRLRRKIEIDATNPSYLHTVRGIGYRLLTDT